MKATPTYTALDAAEKLNVTDARIRQICIQYYPAVGTKHGRAWMLNDADLAKIKRLVKCRKIIGN